MPVCRQARVVRLAVRRDRALGPAQPDPAPCQRRQLPQPLGCAVPGAAGSKSRPHRVPTPQGGENPPVPLRPGFPAGGAVTFLVHTRPSHMGKRA